MFETTHHTDAPAVSDIRHFPEPDMPAITATRILTGNAGVLSLQSHPYLSVSIAAGCLIAPEDGDLVCAMIQSGQAYVLSVLERKSAGTPLTISTQNCPLHIIAPSLSLEGKESVTIKTTRFSLISHTSKWVAQTLRQIAGSLFVSAENAHKKVENLDITQAGHIAMHAEKSMVLDNEIGAITSRAVLRIDGGQVHMG